MLGSLLGQKNQLSALLQSPFPSKSAPFKKLSCPSKHSEKELKSAHTKSSSGSSNPLPRYVPKSIASSSLKSCIETQKHHIVKNRAYGTKQTRFASFQIDPPKTRMETGKEAPCRRFYDPKNDPYELSEFEALKKLKGWADENVVPDPIIGIEKLKSDFDPPKVLERDNPLDPMITPGSWWSRPYYFRNTIQYFTRDKASEIRQHTANMFTFEGKHKDIPNTISSIVKYAFQVAKDDAYSITPQRLNQVLDDVHAREQKDMLLGTEEIGVPVIERVILEQARKFRIAWREDWKDFWRENPPLEPWQVPRGLAEPDPYVNPNVTKTILTNELLNLSSNHDDELYAAISVMENPFKSPLQAVKLYTAYPLAARNKAAILDHFIRLRENERRNRHRPGSINAGVMDIVLDHLPGWNHATHTYDHGRRNLVLRQVFEEDEVMARYPEPIEEVSRPYAPPPHIETLFDWRAFPDPVYSPYAFIDAITNAKGLQKLHIGDIEGAKSYVPEHLRAKEGPHEKRRHWLYLINPAVGHDFKEGLLEDPISQSVTMALQGQRKDALEESLQDSPFGKMLRDSGIPATRSAMLEALTQQEKNMPDLPDRINKNPIIQTAIQAWTYIRHGAAEGNPSTAWQRFVEVMLENRKIPRAERLKVSSVIKELIVTYKDSLKHRREVLKTRLGISDAKLAYMRDYLTDKERARNDAHEEAKIQKELGDYTNSSLKPNQFAQELADILDGKHISSQNISRPPLKTTSSTPSKSLQDAIEELKSDPIFDLSRLETDIQKKHMTQARSAVQAKRDEKTKAQYNADDDQKKAYVQQSKREYEMASKQRSNKQERSYSTYHGLNQNKSDRRPSSVVKSWRTTYLSRDAKYQAAQYRYYSSKPSLPERFTEWTSKLAESVLSPDPTQTAQAKVIKDLTSEFKAATSELLSDSTDANTQDSKKSSSIFQAEDFTSQLGRAKVMSTIKNLETRHQNSLGPNEFALPNLNAAKEQLKLAEQPEQLYDQLATDREKRLLELKMNAKQSNFTAEEDPNLPHLRQNIKRAYGIDPSVTAKSFTSAVWGISKAVGRVLGNAFRDTFDRITTTKIPDLLDRDMNKLIEMQTRATKDAFWDKWRSQLLLNHQSIKHRLPGLLPTLNQLVGTMRPTHTPTSEVDWSAFSYTGDTNVQTNPYLVLDYVKYHLQPKVDVNGEVTAVEDHRSIRSRLETYADHDKFAKSLRQMFAFYSSKRDESRTTDSIFSDLLNTLIQSRLTLQTSVSQGKGMLKALKELQATANPVGNIGAKQIIAEQIWDDPRVRFHSPEAWKQLSEEYEVVKKDIQEHQHREMLKTGMELSDFERMLFEVQPYLDRIAANPGDVKNRCFYILKIEEMARQDILQPKWTPESDETEEWLARFREADAELHSEEVKRSFLFHGRVKAPVDPFPTQQSDMLLQLGFPDLVPGTYRTHKYYPFMRVHSDGTLEDLNPNGELDPLLDYAKSFASEDDLVHQQKARTPFNTLRQLLNHDPQYIIRNWIRTMAHLKYKKQIEASWNPLASDADIPRLIADLKARLEEAKRLRDSENQSEASSSNSPSSINPSTESEYKSLKQLLSDLTTAFANTQPSNDPNQLKTSVSLPTLKESGLPKEDYYSFVGMVAALDPNIKSYSPPPLFESYLEASGSKESDFDFSELILNLSEAQQKHEAFLDDYVLKQRADLTGEEIARNFYLDLPYHPIPLHRSLSTHVKGKEPLILNAEMMPDNISTGLMQYLASYRINMKHPDRAHRMQVWLSQRPELVPYIVKLSEYHERFMKASMTGEPLPYGDDLDKNIFHWTVEDFVNHFTTGFLDDMRVDRLMALSDMHVMLWGNDSEKQLLRQRRRAMQKAALLQLKKKVTNTPAAEALSTSPTLYQSSLGGEEVSEYTLAARIDATLDMLADVKDISAEEELSDLDNPEVLMLAINTPKTPEEIERDKFYLLTTNAWVDDPRYLGLDPVQAAIQRKKDELNPPPAPQTEYIRSKAVLADENTKIEAMKARFLQHPFVSKQKETPVHLPKDMVPLAGLDPNDYLKPVTATDVTYQSLHLPVFDPEKPSTYGNFPYEWKSNNDSRSDDSTRNNKNPIANIVGSKHGLSLDELLDSNALLNEEYRASIDPGVKLAQLIGDPTLIKEAKFLSSIRDFDPSDHGSEKTIRFYEFCMLKVSNIPSYRIPRRVVFPEQHQVKMNQTYRNQNVMARDAASWVRSKYVTWFGQDPRSPTFDVWSAFHQYNNVTSAVRPSEIPLSVPSPTTIWGPTMKSMKDLENELRFQLTLKVPNDVEKVLQEERDKFIKELEARLVAYSAIQESIMLTQKEKEVKRDARLKALEEEQAKIEEEADKLLDAEYWAKLEAEKAALLKEKEQAKISAVQEREVAAGVTSVEEMIQFVTGKAPVKPRTPVPKESPVIPIPEAITVGKELQTVDPNAPHPTKTEEQLQIEEIIESRRKVREEQERKNKKAQEKANAAILGQKYVEEREDDAEVAAKRLVRTSKRRLLRPMASTRPRGLRKRFRRPGDFKMRTVHATFADYWKEYGLGRGPTFSTALFHQLTAENVQFLMVNVLNGTPNVVRLNCHPDVIEAWEKFYADEYPKMSIVGATPVGRIAFRYAKRGTDDAFISTSIWAQPVYYMTKYAVPDTNRVIDTTFQGICYAIIQSTPENEFYVTGWAFDRGVVEVPTDALPKNHRYRSNREMHEMQAEDPEVMEEFEEEAEDLSKSPKAEPKEKE